MTTLTIDIWSDVMCPWCLVGWGNLRQALDTLDGEIAAEIRWRPFELNPDMPAEGEEQEAHLRRKYGRSAADGQAVRERMRTMAAEADVSLEWQGEGEPPPAMMWNTFAAHRLLAWALESAGPERQTALKLALFRAHFNHRRRVGEESVLLDIVEEAGLDRVAARVALDEEALSSRVRAEQRQAFDLNITGVPAMVVAGKFLIPGAQPAETYVNALRRVAAKAQG
ncbi:DsbA family oxidoreductase [Pelagerythrobacter marensis]|uniref:Putative 2-hydroxychromene-2-carboxylateisomerase family protein n=1 Tax=Pelagerythrobacter marensis TaxID=543877 RepID=A0A0G3X7N0_9SPHN|nr:DsbA family oxidoreductase [Pelagerythrobacter marensis]AKM07535.1 putative 2-hydroxychromene-2-carboxylateisomerase family protein [Pelagerythrobacter marensis]